LLFFAGDLNADMPTLCHTLTICIEDEPTKCAIDFKDDDTAYNVHALIQYCNDNSIYAHGCMEEDTWNDCIQTQDADRYNSLFRALIWKLIERFEIAGAVDKTQPKHVREVLGKDALKAWANGIMQSSGLDTPLEIKNFRVSWEDGRGFLALLNHAIKITGKDKGGFELVDLNSVDTSTDEAKMENCQKAFDGIRAVLGVFRMLTPDIVVLAATANALRMKSTCTYLATIHTEMVKAGDSGASQSSFRIPADPKVADVLMRRKRSVCVEPSLALFTPLS